jgi:hypothetical protein
MTAAGTRRGNCGVLAASLPGQSRWAAPTPVLFVLTPLTLVGFLAPLTSGVRLPAGRSFTPPVPSSNSSGRSTCRAPSVFVMEPTDARNLHYPALARPLRRPMLGRVFSQG